MRKDIQFFEFLKEEIEREKNANTVVAGDKILNLLNLLIAEKYDQIPEKDEEVGNDMEALYDEVAGRVSDFYKTPLYHCLTNFEKTLYKLRPLYKRFVEFKNMIGNDEAKNEAKILVESENEAKSLEDIEPSDIESLIISPAEARLESILEEISFEKFFFMPAVFPLMQKLGVINDSESKANEKNFSKFISQENIQALKNIQKEGLVNFLRGCQTVLANEIKIQSLSEIQQYLTKPKSIHKSKINDTLIDNAWNKALCYALSPAERNKFNVCEFHQQLSLEFSYGYETVYGSEYKNKDPEPNEALIAKFKDNNFLTPGQGLGRAGALGNGIKFEKIPIVIKKGQPYTPEEGLRVILRFIERLPEKYVAQFGKSVLIEWMLKSIQMPDYFYKPFYAETQTYGISPFEYAGGEAEITFKFDKAENKLFIEFVNSGALEARNPDSGTKFKFKNENITQISRIYLTKILGDEVISKGKSILYHAVTEKDLNLEDKREDKSRDEMVDTRDDKRENKGFKVKDCLQNIGYSKEEEWKNSPAHKKNSVNLFVQNYAHSLIGDEIKISYKNSIKDFDALQYLSNRDIYNDETKKTLNKLQKEFDDYYSKNNLEVFFQHYVNDFQQFILEEKSENKIKNMAGKVKFNASQLITIILRNSSVEDVNIKLEEFKNRIDTIVMNHIDELKPQNFYQDFFNKKEQLFKEFLKNNSKSCKAEIVISSARFKYEVRKELKDRGEKFDTLFNEFQKSIDYYTVEALKINTLNNELSKEYLDKIKIIFLNDITKIRNKISDRLKLLEKLPDPLDKNPIITLREKVDNLESRFLQKLISASNIFLDYPHLYIEKIEELENFEDEINEFDREFQDNLNQIKLEVISELNLYISSKNQEIERRTIFRCFSSGNDRLIVAKKLHESLTGKPTLIINSNDIRLIKSDPQLNRMFSILQITQQLPLNFTDRALLEQQKTITGITHR